jgi:ADP-ribose pyrophosphatase YjhB (NUDIX family)
MTLPPDYRFCHRCAKPLEMAVLDGHQRPRCTACGMVVYLDPKVVACGLVGVDGKVLLVRRLLQPGIGLWALPAGHVNRGEVVEDAVKREILEETGLRVSARRLVGVYSEWGDLIILAAYDVAVGGGALQPDAVEVSDARFFSVDTLPDLAFPRDRRVIQDWLRLGAGRD